MKRSPAFTRVLSLALLLSCVAPASASGQDQAAKLPTAEAVLNGLRAARWTDGRKEAPSNTTMKGRWSLTGFEGEGTFEDVLAGSKAHARGEFPGWGVFEQGSDGEVIWEANPISGVIIKEGADADSTRRMLGMFAATDWRELYTEAACTGVEALGDRPHYRLELTARGGAKDVWLVDSETHLIGRIDMRIKNSMGAEMDMQMRFSDWKVVDGVRYPFKREMKGGPVTVVYTTDSVAHDRDLPADRFDLPAKVREALEKTGGERTPEKFELRELEAQHVMTVRVKCKTEEIGRHLASILPEVMMYLNAAGERPSGAPFTRYWSFGPAEVDLEAGMPVSKPVAGNDRIKAQTLPAGKVVVGWHTGPYERLHETYTKLEGWIAEQGLESLGGQWEVYWTDPGLQPDASKWRTQIFCPVSARK